jgi:cyclomaltodextrinase
VYVRNHGAPHMVLEGLDADGDAPQKRATKSHTLVELVEDFDRIAAMGFDYVYMLPIHPPGRMHKKGSMGCPYSIRDYTDVDPKLGNIGDFEQLVVSAAERGLGVVMDIVYNHTAFDSVIANELPMCVA